VRAAVLISVQQSKAYAVAIAFHHHVRVVRGHSCSLFSDLPVISIGPICKHMKRSPLISSLAGVALRQLLQFVLTASLVADLV
jgi:hypothetical protein